MNGIDNIIAKINAERDTAIAEINAQSGAKCREIAEACTAKSQAEYDRIFTKGVSDAAALIERRGSTAALDAKKHVLAVKQEMLTLAFDRALEMLSEMPADEYIAFLASLAAKAAVTGTEKLILSTADRTRCGKSVCVKANELLAARGINAALTLSERTVDIRGGLFLLLDSGDVEVNCSIEALVVHAKHDMAAQAAAVLFD